MLRENICWLQLYHNLMFFALTRSKFLFPCESIVILMIFYCNYFNLPHCTTIVMIYNNTTTTCLYLVEDKNFLTTNLMLIILIRNSKKALKCFHSCHICDKIEVKVYQIQQKPVPEKTNSQRY